MTAAAAAAAVMCVIMCVCTGDPAWEVKALVAGQEPPNSLQLLKEQQATKAAAEKEAAEKEAAAQKAAADKKAADAAAAAAAQAAAQAAAANDASREVQVQTNSGIGSSGQAWGGMDLHDQASVQAEAAQQRQWTAIIGQAASWGTMICIAGLMGLVVLWQMRGPSSSGGPLMGRRWGRYAPLQRRPPSPSPADRMV